MNRLIIIWILSLFYAFAATTESIRDFEVNITLEQSGEFTITENILYDFGDSYSKHGIYRDIPPGGKIMGMYVDAGLKDFSVLMDGKKVKWQKFRHGNMIRLNIGDKEHIVDGRHLYTIKYRCTNGILPSSEKANGLDMIHWNATGNRWDARILYAQVNLFLPPQLNSDNVKLANHKLIYGNKWVTKHHLRVESDGYLSIMVIFPQGILTKSGAGILEKAKAYKEQEKLKFIAKQKRVEKEKQEAKVKRLSDSLYYWIPLMFITLFLWLKGLLGGKKADKSIVVQYNPPPNLSVLQSGILLDKFSDMADYSAAILELAHLGHIIIEEKEEKTVLRKRHHKSKLTKDQKEFLDTLFYDSETFDLKSLKNSNQKILGEKMTEINKSLYAWAKTKGYAVENFAKLRKKAEIVIFVIMSISILYAIYKEVLIFPTESGFVLLFATIFFLPGVVASFFRIKIVTKLAILVAGVGVGIMVTKLPFWVKNDITPIDVLTSHTAAMYVLFIIAMLVYKNLGHLTRKGKDIQNYLKGLEHFITHAKEDEIKRRLKEDPYYLEKLIPYAILFGQIEHWLKIYDLMNLPKPKWNNASMGSISSIHISYIPYSSSSSSRYSGGSYGGSYGGGSFSGGGFGGGGGGSW